jgi:hypothetical protein
MLCTKQSTARSQRLYFSCFRVRMRGGTCEKQVQARDRCYVQKSEVRRGLGMIASLDRGFLATLGGTLVLPPLLARDVYLLSLFCPGVKSVVISIAPKPPPRSPWRVERRLRPRNQESALCVCFASAAVKIDMTASYDVSAARASRLRVNVDFSGISSIGGSGDGARRNVVRALSGRRGKVQAHRLYVAMSLITQT